jgi:putative NADH-flavin reductase
METDRRVVIVGATGRTGLRVLDAAVARGVAVLAVVRDADKLGARRGRVRVAAGDARDGGFLRAALGPGDAVISALGSGRDDPAGDAVARGTEAILAAMEAVGAGRFLGVLGAGVLLDEEGVQRHARPDYPPQFRRIAAQHQAALEACQRSRVSWALLGCPRIVDGDATGRLAVLRERLPPGIGQVSTGDLAALLVREALTPSAEGVRLGVNQSA